MYSPRIIERAQSKIEATLGVKLQRHSPSQSYAVADHLSQLVKPGGSLKRALNADENAFITNELLLSRIDFLYFLRYCSIELDGGGAGPLVPKESQVLAVERHLAPAEEEMMAAVERGEVVDGLRFYWNKARQLYATTTARALTWHRLLFHRNIKAMCAPAEETQILDLYNRDHTILDGLPWWMRPSMVPDDGSYDVKAEQLWFGTRKSGCYYYSGSTKGSIGQGSQFQIQHITEAAFWPVTADSDSATYQLDYILDPSLPQSPQTLAIRESTANGRGNWWHDKTEDARHGRSLWRYIFMPWYVVSSKRRRTPPSNWTPDEVTLKHADLVLATSAEWTGHPVTLAREQLYWWESERKEYQKNNNLALFLTNYPATPEQSMQHHANAAFTPELIEAWRAATSVPTLALEVLCRA